MQNLPGGVHETRHGETEPRVNLLNLEDVTTSNNVLHCNVIIIRQNRGSFAEYMFMMIRR